MEILALISFVICEITETIRALKYGFDVWYWVSLALFIFAVTLDILSLILEKKKNDNSKHLK